MNNQTYSREQALKDRELIANLLEEHGKLKHSQLMPLTGLSSRTLSVRLNTMKSGQVVTQDDNGLYRLVVPPRPEHYPAMVRRWFGYPIDADRRVI
jgi:hypothetical protein